MCIIETYNVGFTVYKYSFPESLSLNDLPQKGINSWVSPHTSTLIKTFQIFKSQISTTPPNRLLQNNLHLSNYFWYRKLSVLFSPKFQDVNDPCRPKLGRAKKLEPKFRTPTKFKSPKAFLKEGHLRLKIRREVVELEPEQAERKVRRRQWSNWRSIGNAENVELCWKVRKCKCMSPTGRCPIFNDHLGKSSLVSLIWNGYG